MSTGTPPVPSLSLKTALTWVRLFLLAAVSLVVGSGAALAQVNATAAAPQNGEYLIGGGDLLKITVYQNPDLSTETRVSEAGTISFPLLGTLRVGGISGAQVETLIGDSLKKGSLVKQPQVTVLVLQVRANQVSVLGQVNRPGRFPLEASGIRLSDILAMAGGVAPTGADKVTLTRPNGGGAPFRGDFDIASIFSGTNPTEDFQVFNGDVLYIDRAPVFYIYGEVQKPGATRLERSMTVLQGLAAGGGLTLRGTERGLKVHRRSADGKVMVLEPKLNDPLLNGDVIYVRESLF